MAVRKRRSNKKRSGSYLEVSDQIIRWRRRRNRALKAAQALKAAETPQPRIRNIFNFE